MLIRFVNIVVICLLLTCLSACEPNKEPDNEAPHHSTASAINAEESKAPSAKPRLRSWQEIKDSGFIRAVKLDWEEESALPRSGSTSIYHRELLNQFAAEHGLTVNWLQVSDFEQMFALLANYQVDVIPRHLTITKQRAQQFDFTYPLLRDREVVVAKADSKAIDGSEDLSVTLAASSAFINSVQTSFPHWHIHTLAQNKNSEQLADDIASGAIQYTLMDGFAYDVLKQYRQDIHTVFTMPKAINLAWLVNKGSDNFLGKLNEFISVHHVSLTVDPIRKVDFKQLKKKRLPLRVITRNSPETYFLWRGELLGFEYELMKRFADIHHLGLEMVVAGSYEEMLTLLKEGKGDVIAAGLSRTESRLSAAKQEKVSTSIRYNRVDELLVAHADSAEITDYQDLKGRTLVVRKSSSFWQTAQALSDKYGVIVEAADETVATELLIAQVAEKQIDLTIADSNLMAIEQEFRPEILAPLVLKESIPYAYVTRQSNPQLLAHLNEFIRKHYRKEFYNVVKNKYFRNKRRKAKHRESRLQSGAALSPYDDIVQQQVKEYHFDWRLIVSQMYQESRFDPNASNPTGALGLMQMLPRTAKELGVTNLTEPEQAISSGVRYLDWTRNRFSKELPVQEQIFFSLASYNAGYGHVKDAQRLARKMGLRDDKWFNNVERAMLLLQQRKYYQHARFGYVRGSEPVAYVRKIHQRYLSYIKITQ